MSTESGCTSPSKVKVRLSCRRTVSRSWYTSRHVLPALAAAGYHAVAPDMRGYGQTDAPPEIKDYARPQAVADMGCLVRALGYEEAVIAGHDQGAGSRLL
jgi:pimeloyl-ACP methyl ester carboxylesterase